MKPPSQPARFRAPVRHYHRHTSKSEPSWDSWIGAGQKPRSRFLIPLASLVIVILISALLVLGFAIA
ncbi:hypothetical protein [Luteolibacter rhizosphaerae]|uniref:hypothetical protein n=1 Tax=Luteolibacter rhizosphaerae TaxID=2989719 RepID=UPI002222387F|nr:hypothetical protein [Luteolibacter rhizosphaerae]